MSVLIIKNTGNEGPGTIEEFLREKNRAYSVVDFSGCDATEESIPDIRNHTHLVIMGGPMAVYESSGLPFLHFEVAMVRAFAKSGRPVLGICLGAQIIAHALNAEVFAGKTEELGWSSVAITEEGMDDPVFSNLAVRGKPAAEVFQWHGDTFRLPGKTVRLASSETYDNQAFRYGSSVYGLQFHIEVTPGMIGEWFQNSEGVDGDAMVQHALSILPEYRQRAFGFYEKFFI